MAHSTGSLGVERTMPQDPTHYQTWDAYTNAGLKPIIYQANGSFASLVKTGKLGSKPEGSSLGDFSSGGFPSDKREAFMPGYTGNIRGSQHVHGRTFGEMSKRCMTRDYREILCTSPIPSNCEKNRKITHINPPNSFMTHIQGKRKYHIPGYTGFVPGARPVYGGTYGRVTEQQFEKFDTDKVKYNGISLQKLDETHAATLLDRKPLNLQPNPLPGGIRTYEPPVKLIPKHVKVLTFGPY